MSDWLDPDDLEKELDDLQGRLDDEDDPLDEEEHERLKALADLETELGGWSVDTLIPDDEFEDYAREFAYDIGMVERESSIEPYVDWERWSNDLKHDFTCVTFESEDYYTRER